jgi:hypothetical protein
MAQNCGNVYKYNLKKSIIHLSFSNFSLPRTDMYVSSGHTVFGEM